MAIFTRIKDERDFNSLVSDLVTRFDLTRNDLVHERDSIRGLDLGALQVLYGVLPMLFFDGSAEGVSEIAGLWLSEHAVFAQIVRVSPVSRMHALACYSLFSALMERTGPDSFWNRRPFRHGNSAGSLQQYSAQYQTLIELVAAILLKRRVLVVHEHLVNEALRWSDISTRARAKRVFQHPKFCELSVDALKNWAAQPEIGEGFYRWFAQTGDVPSRYLLFIERETRKVVDQFRNPEHKALRQFLQPGSDSLAAYHALVYWTMLRLGITLANIMVDD